MCRKRILHISGRYRTKSGEDVLQHLVSGLVLALHLVHSCFDGDSVHMDWLVINHIGRRHGRGLVVKRRAGEGTLDGVVSEAEEFNGNPKRPMVSTAFRKLAL